MPYSPQFIALSTIATILIILFAIGVLLYNEKHYRYDIEDVTTCVDQPEKTVAMVKAISKATTK